MFSINHIRVTVKSVIQCYNGHTQPQIRLLLTIARVYKLYLLTYMYCLHSAQTGIMSHGSLDTHEPVSKRDQNHC